MGFSQIIIVLETLDALSKTVVAMQVQKEAPPDMQCKDKFLVQSVIVAEGTSAKDITGDMVLHILTSVCEISCLMFVCAVLMVLPIYLL